MAAGTVAIASLRDVPATCLLTLSARAKESARSDALFHDPMAAAILGRLEWEPSVYDRDWIVQTGIAIRTGIIDAATHAYVAAHPGAVVVNLGAGLCTRWFRLDDGKLKWVDVDLPEVIRLRERLIPAHERCRALACSVLDKAWMERIGEVEGRSVLFVAEGLLQYFDPGQVELLLCRMAERFPGAHMLLEAVSPLARACSRWQPSLVAAGVRIRWSLSDAADLERWSDRIRVVDSWYYDRPRIRWRWLRTLGWIGRVRKLMTIVHLEFAREGNPGAGLRRGLGEAEENVQCGGSA